MKLLNAGDHILSNADVLDWITRKRAQHKREDEEEKGRGVPTTPRPKNFMTSLKRHERELSSTKYPYTKNPSAYAGENRSTTFQKFCLDAENTLQDHLENEWRDRLNTMSKQQIDKDFVPKQESKCLSETELLSIFNHAPISVDMLQPMIDNVEERFSADEQQLLVDVIMSTLRCDEEKAADGDAQTG